MLSPLDQYLQLAALKKRKRKTLPPLPAPEPVQVPRKRTAK